MPVIVTYLEMRTPAQTREIAAPDGVTLRQVKPTLPWYRDIFSRVGQDWLWYGRLRLSDTELTGILENPDLVYFTLTKDGQDEALLELDFRKKGECELAYFGLTSALIGTGAGRYLMNAAIHTAWARPITRFHVHTCTNDSPQALNFYIRSGFVPVQRAIEVDDDPRLSGLLPRTAAPHIPII